MRIHNIIVGLFFTTLAIAASTSITDRNGMHSMSVNSDGSINVLPLPDPSGSPIPIPFPITASSPQPVHVVIDQMPTPSPTPSTLYYQTMQSNGIDQTQRSKLNFSSLFSLSDSSPATGVDLGTVTLSHGGTGGDLSATGGTSQVLKQTSVGGAVSVARLACSDLSNSSASCSTDATNAANINSGLLSIARGGTGSSLSATGGTSQVLKQTTLGGNVTVGQLVCGDLSNSSASCATDATNASNISSGTLALARGGTGVDLSATGGTSQVLKQNVSHVISAGQLACSDLSNASASCATDATNATNITSGILGYAEGGTNANTSWTQGSVFFAGASAFAQNNTKLFWDNSGFKFGINTGSPGAALEVDTPATGTKSAIIKMISSQSVDALEIQNSSASSLFTVDKNGFVNMTQSGVVLGSNSVLQTINMTSDSTAFSSGTNNSLVGLTLSTTLTKPIPSGSFGSTMYGISMGTTSGAAVASQNTKDFENAFISGTLVSSNAVSGTSNGDTFNNYGTNFLVEDNIVHTSSGTNTVNTYGINSTIVSGGSSSTGTVNKTDYGIYSVVGSKTGAHYSSIAYGVYSSVSGAGTNYDIYASSSGANSYFAGSVGIATTSPQQKLDVNGLIRMSVQGAGVTPSCAAGTNGTLALTSAYILCVCNGSSFVKTADGSTACTF